MKSLYERWINEAPPISVDQPGDVAPPAAGTNRGSWLEHALHGALRDVPSELVGKLQEEGWRVRLAPDDFLEFAHLQAWEFQSRWFPQLHWSLLWAPSGSAFVLGDRPVIWQADGFVNVPPAALRHPTAHLIAPLSPRIALLGSVSHRRDEAGITPEYVNLLSATSALSWIFGSAHSVVEHALETLNDARRG